MRTLSTAQEDVLRSPKYDVYLRVEVESSSGAYSDLTSLGSGNWVEGARWDWSLDQPVPQVNVSLRRDHGLSSGESLAPLDENSTLNVIPSSSNYAARIDVGRGLRVFTATKAAGAAAPTTSEYDWMFDGEIDEIKWSKSPMQVVARSKIMSHVADRWIESTSGVYGSAAGTAIETVIGDILTEWTSLDGASLSLWTPTSPSFLITPQYSPDRQPVLRAITTLAQLIGWDVREHWSSSAGAFQLKFYEPDRTPSTTNYIFGSSEYFDVNEMAISRKDVRNHVSVIYGTSTSSRSEVTAESTASQDKYGRQWMQIEEGTNSAITLSSEAQALADAALADLQDPPAIQEIELPYWWPAELQDYYGFEGNDIHYTTKQELGVYGISHELSRKRQRTRIRVRGKPAGQYTQWLTYPGGGDRKDTALGFGFLTVDGTALKVSAGALEENVDGVYYRVSKNGASPGSNPPWPDVSSTDEQFIDAVNFPYTSNANSTTGSAISMAGDDLAEATFRFIDKSGIMGQPIYHSVVAPTASTDGVPANRIELMQIQWVSEEKVTPAVADNFSFTAPSTSVILQWDDNSTDEYTYYVERATDNSGSPGNWNLLTSTGIAAGSTTYTDSTITSTSTTYWYRVRPRSPHALSSAYSAELEADLSLA